jgi:NADPH:quinone reductase
LHARRRLNYVGTTERTRSIDENDQVSRLANDDLWALVVNGEIKSPIDKVFGIEDVAIALDRMNNNQHLGKIALLLDD